MIKIKSRNVYRNEELIGKVVGERFPENYRRLMKVSCNFAYIPIKDGVTDYENRMDLSMFGYFKDACEWLKINLA